MPVGFVPPMMKPTGKPPMSEAEQRELLDKLTDEEMRKLHEPDPSADHYEWKYDGPIAGTTDFYDDADWLEHQRIRADVHATACRLLADLIAPSERYSDLIAEITVRAAALSAILEQHTSGMDRVAAVIASVGPASSGPAKPRALRKRRATAIEAKPLTDRERQAVQLADEGHGPTAIGKRMGVTKSYAATLRDKGREKLKSLQLAVRASGNSARPKSSIADVQFKTDDD